jgi:hypothetical protein
MARIHCSAPLGGRGSTGFSFIPQIGQLPGFGRTTSGCIGHVHDAAESASLGAGACSLAELGAGTKPPSSAPPTGVTGTDSAAADAG